MAVVGLRIGLIALDGGAPGLTALALGGCPRCEFVFLVVRLMPLSFALGRVNRSEGGQPRFMRGRADLAFGRHDRHIDPVGLAKTLHHLQIDRFAQRRRIPRNDQQHPRALRRDDAITNRVDIVVVFEFDNLNRVHSITRGDPNVRSPRLR